jgi:hypothetical protein
MNVCSAREIIRLPRYLSHIQRPIFSAETSAFRLRLREEKPSIPGDSLKWVLGTAFRRIAAARDDDLKFRQVCQYG